MNKCTLLIDGNWLLMSRFFIYENGFLVKNDEYAKEKASKDLEELLARSINLILNRFQGTIDNLVMITDGGSWRKQLPKPAGFNEAYKGNRVQEKKFDWHYVYGALNRLARRFEEMGITTCWDNDVEGDDWCWYWSRRLNAEGTNCMIWSSDNDLKQLVQVKDGVFTCWYNDKNGLFFHKDLDDTNEDVIDFFMQQSKDNYMTLSLKKQANNDYHYVDPYDIISSKIICGDAGDNIKSLIRIEKNGRTYKVGEKEWSRCREKLHIDCLDNFLNSKELIVENLLKTKKYRDYNINKDNIYEMFDFNTKLVWLDEHAIPDSIIQRMNEMDYKLYDISYIINNMSAMLGTDEEVEKIFEGIE